MSEKSQVASPGPVSTFLPTLPNVPCVGTMKAFGSNHCVVVPRTTGPAKAGFQDGRTGLRESLSPDGLKLNSGVKGKPDCNVMMLFAVHPPRNPLATPLMPEPNCLPWPNGSS